jgi:hypothetical protein
MEYSKSAAFDETINPAIVTGKLAVPEAAPFNVKAMEYSFYKDVGGGPVPIAGE